MNFLRRRLYEDSYNIELRHYYLIDLILNEKWIDIIDILEETPFIHSNLIEFVFKYYPLTMNNNKRIEILKQRLKSFQIYNKKDLSVKAKNSFEIYRNELLSSSSSSSSLISNESFHQTILFISKAKIYKKNFHWIKIGKGECEIIENNQTEKFFIRFWIIKNSSINLILLINLYEHENFFLLSNNYSSFIIKFQAKNQCEYPNSNDFILYKLKFYSIVDLIQFKQILSLRKKDIYS